MCGRGDSLLAKCSRLTSGCAGVAAHKLLLTTGTFHISKIDSYSLRNLSASKRVLSISFSSGYLYVFVYSLLYSQWLQQTQVKRYDLSLSKTLPIGQQSVHSVVVEGLFFKKKFCILNQIYVARLASYSQTRLSTKLHLLLRDSAPKETRLQFHKHGPRYKKEKEWTAEVGTRPFVPVNTVHMMDESDADVTQTNSGGAGA